MSEPSNPWISGVATLFSIEFYDRIRHHLKPGGLFVQWLQLYEINLPLVATVMNAVGSRFADYVVIAADDLNILVIASADGSVTFPRDWSIPEGPLGEIAAYVGLRGPADLAVRRVGTRRTLAPYFATVSRAANSDYFPVLDQNAAKQRFMKAVASELVGLHRYSSRLFGGAPDSRAVTPVRYYGMADSAVDAALVARHLDSSMGAEDASAVVALEALRAIFRTCNPRAIETVWLGRFQIFSIQLVAFLDPVAVRRLVDELRGSACHARASSRVRSWIAFFEAVGLRRWSDVRSLGEELLDGAPGDNRITEHLQAEVLLAALNDGGPAIAQQHLRKWGNDVASSPGLNYLKAVALYSD